MQPGPSRNTRRRLAQLWELYNRGMPNPATCLSDEKVVVNQSQLIIKADNSDVDAGDCLKVERKREESAIQCMVLPSFSRQLIGE